MIDFKKYLVVKDYDDKYYIWTREEYDKYTRGCGKVGAGSAYKVVTHFEGDESLLSLFDKTDKPINGMGHAKEMAEKRYTDKYAFNEQLQCAYMQCYRDIREDPTEFALAEYSAYQTEKIEREYVAGLLETAKEIEDIEFAEWCVENLQSMFNDKGQFKFWIKNSGIHEKDISTAEAYQEFLLYKKQKQ